MINELVLLPSESSSGCDRIYRSFHFIVILPSHLVQSMDTVAFDHSRVKIPLPAAVSLHT